MEFEFATATRIIFGTGTLREVGALARGFGQRALLVTGRAASRAARVGELLQQGGVSATSFSVPGEPGIARVEQGLQTAREAGCNMVVGFGGGGALDAAKAIAAMLTNDGGLLDYVEIIGRGRALTKPSAPFIAIPTTAGTGSEVTRNAVLTSPEQRVKVSLRSPFLLAKVALVDPGLTLDLPAALTATTGLDALTQLIEPYVCTRANPMTDALCVAGMRRAARSLRVAFHEGRNAAAREDMAMAGLFGGLALANAGLGAVHGLAGPIGGLLPAPHGAVCAALLPSVMAANLRALRERQPGNSVLARFEDIARLLTERTAATAEEGVAWLRTLVAELRIPPLSAHGLEQEHIAELITKATQASSMKANPITLTGGEMRGVVEEAL